MRSLARGAHGWKEVSRADSSTSLDSASLWVHDHARDFAVRTWVVDPAFILDLVHQQLKDGDAAPARQEAYFAGVRI